MSYRVAQKMADGELSEAMVKDFLMANGWSCRKTKPKDPEEPFDFVINNKTSGHWRTIEIKTYGNDYWGTIFAETFQPLDNSVPEYLLHGDKIDYMIYVHQETKRAFIYNMKAFVSYVKAHKWEEKLIKEGSALGIKIKQYDKEAGWIKTIDL